MNSISVEQGPLKGCLILTPASYGDSRGLFQELFRTNRYHELGIREEFVQDNYSRSVKGTLRGLHYQVTHPQGKLVQVLRGEVFDVCVDLRRSSPTFGQWASVILSEENHRQFYIPPGFAHGFYVLSEGADFFYKCTDYFAPEHERTIRWDDADLGIEWPLTGSPTLSAKDQQGQAFCDATYPDMT